MNDLSALRIFATVPARAGPPPTPRHAGVGGRIADVAHTKRRGDRFPLGGSAFPLGGSAFPLGGSAFPLRSNAFPPTGSSLPLGGRSFPPWGDAFPPVL